MIFKDSRRFYHLQNLLDQREIINKNNNKPKISVIKISIQNDHIAMIMSKEIRKEMLGASEVSPAIMNQIHQERLLQIWVPKKYGGLGFRLKE